MPETTKSEAEAVADLVRKSGDARTIVVTGQDGSKAELLLTPEGNGGMKAQGVKAFVDAYRTKPERREGTAVLLDLASFIAHTNRFKDDDSAIFAIADPEHPSLMSVLDYHKIGSEADPRFGKHRGKYLFPLSDEWKAWKEGNGVEMNQAQFADFLENRIIDVLDPEKAGFAAIEYAKPLGVTFASPSALLTLSYGLSIRVDQRIVNKPNITTGEAVFKFEAEHQDESGAPLKVPGAFLIGIPFFRDGFSYQLPVRLRYRVRGDKVVWVYEMARVEVSFSCAFNEARDKARVDTGLPVFMGSPE